MKNALFALLFLCFLGQAHATSYDLLIRTASQPQLENSTPFRGFAHFLDIPKHKIKNTPLQGQQVGYSEGEVDAVFNHAFCPTWGMAAGIGFNNERLDWKGNPYFQKKDFTRANVAVTAFTAALKGWLWQVGLGVNAETNRPLANYAIYDSLLWGRYVYSENLGLHVGFLGSYGLKKQEYYPILGFDFRHRKWTFNLIFPIDMSIRYSLKRQWAVEVSLRPISSRHRLGSNEPLSRGIVEYRTVGTELALRYTPGAKKLAKLFVGTTGTDHLRVFNSQRSYSNATLFKLRPAVYFGVDLSIRF